jgi:hypothetical protein
VNAVAMGTGAGQSSQGASSIILNATGNPLNNSNANRFVVKPVRTATVTSNTMAYTSGTGEVSDNTNVSFDTNGQIGIGTVNPGAILDINRTGSIIVPVGDEEQRPGTPQEGMLRFNDSTKKLEFYTGTGWFALVISGMISSGGLVSEENGFRIHTFKSSGTFSIQEERDIEVLVVAGGGGGGGGRQGGGGGAGGLIFNDNLSVIPGSYTIHIGAGGIGTIQSGGNVGENGSNSKFTLGNTTLIESFGGGRGASETPNANPASGGSGGGGSHAGNILTVTAIIGAAGTPDQGNKGGDGGTSVNTFGAQYNVGFLCGGGGGGASEVGENATTSKAGDGGDGIDPFGDGTFYAGGGGASERSSTRAGTGGLGGGGNGAVQPGAADDGELNTGGGGGAGRGGGTPGGTGGIGGAGGSGIVIIRYQI